MIIRHLLLENFRVFQQKTHIELTTSAQQPLVLFGGLNGAGKTSILTAVRLVLLGKQAFPFVKSQKEYETLLISMLHQDTHGHIATSALLELAFEYVVDGQVVDFVVTRAWNSQGNEKLSICENGINRSDLDHEQSQLYLHELVPPGVADLVFFDGEKIAELAADRTGNVLREAANRLLGLDVVARLQEDLRLYIKKSGAAAAEVSLKQQLAALEAERDQLLTEGRHFRNEADNFFNAIAEYNRKVAQAERQLLTRQGGTTTNKSEQKRQNDQKLEWLQQTAHDLVRKLDSAYPLALAPNTMQQLLQLLHTEAAYQNRSNLRSELSQFLAQVDISKTILAGIDKNKLHETFADLSSAYLNALPKPAVSFGLSSGQLHHLQNQISYSVEQAGNEMLELKQAVQQASQALEHSAGYLATAVEDEQLKQVLDQLRALEHGKQSAIKRYKDKLLEAKTCLNKALQLSHRITRVHQELKNKVGDDESVLRASVVLNLTDDLLVQMESQRLAQIEAELNISYRRLVRKQELDLHTRIDAHSYQVRLYDAAGHEIDHDRLSAGEKQILAFAILDALIKVAGKKLPLVVDTPLGRLDSEHRQKLIENFFPLVSEQVIVLSTDTEIDNGFFAQLHDAIADNRCYQIEFDQQKASSVIKHGYFNTARVN
jgi:DNA sulfur modification protein DndD